MHVLNCDARVYVYDSVAECWLYKFDDYTQLLWFLAKNVSGNLDMAHLKPYKTMYLNNINMGDDYRVWQEVCCTKDGWITKEHVEIRRYMFIDSQNRILDPRKDYDRILELAKSDAMKKPRHAHWYGIAEKDLPVFRQGPVPGTGVRKHGNMIRHPKSFREKRQNTIPETEKFVRAKRRLCHLPDPWNDEDWRPFPKSWKDCTKRQHQWKEKPIRDFSDGFIFATRTQGSKKVILKDVLKLVEKECVDD